MRRMWRAVALCCALIGPAAAQADEVTDQIHEALGAYDKKDLTTAVAALDAAAGLIRQKKTEIWKAALPGPLPGWSADDAEDTAFAPALLGGGTTVSRRYHKDGDIVTVSLIADSPVVQGIAAFLASDVGQLVGDSRVVVLDGRRLLYSKGDNAYRTMVANRVLVKVEGTSGVGDPTLRQYFGAIKFLDIEKMAQ
jgi:hypothetical protein